MPRDMPGPNRPGPNTPGPNLTALLVVCALVGARAASAQTPATSVPHALAIPVSQQASASGGRILGMVRDDVGQALGGVSIVALGTTLAASRSDAMGRFTITLAPGEYILRATRDGYVSTYREPVRVQSSVPLERNITLLRQDSAAQLARASEDVDPDHAHSDAAWRLRYLTRTVLRDGATTTGAVAVAGNGATERDDFTRRGSALDWAVDGSARAASSFFTATDFRGQVNFLTSSSLASSGAGGWRPDTWPRGIASFAVGAPIGDRGDWLVRAAMNASDQSSWVLVGEYAARADQTHAVQAGLSYSTQGFVPVGAVPIGAGPTGSRSVGSAYGFDRWRVRDGLELEYGLRVDRFDYVSVPTLVSPRLGTQVTIFPRTRLVAHASHRMTAPGADEFLPSSSAGPWLPPERTFSPLFPGAQFRAERVRHYDLGLERDFGVRTISVRHFSESARNQVSSLFGLDASSRVGQYYVATSGDVDVDGWVVRLSGQLIPTVTGSLAYTAANAHWADNTMARVLRRVAPSAARRGDDALHDLTASLAASLPRLDTHLSLEYRLNSSFSGPDRAARLPVTDGRFSLELRQKLPYQPLDRGTFEAVFAMRTLLRDLADAVSYYDELLTVAPPLRLLGGVQVRF